MPVLSAYARAGLSSGSISSSSTGPADCGAGLLRKLGGQVVVWAQQSFGVSKSGGFWLLAFLLTAFSVAMNGEQLELCIRRLIALGAPKVTRLRIERTNSFESILFE